MEQRKTQSFRVANRRQIISMENTEYLEPTKAFITINASSSCLFSCNDDDNDDKDNGDDDDDDNNNNNNNNFW